MPRPDSERFKPGPRVDIDKPRGVDAFLEPVQAKPQPKIASRIRLVTATMHFRPDQLDWLQEEARHRGVSSAAIVREAIDAYIKKEGQA